MESPEQRHLAARAFALGLPGAWEDHPWGESVAKVGKKVFVFLGKPGEEQTDRHESGIGVGVKLPVSFLEVVDRPYAQPSGYGLGKAGWASIRFTPDAPTLEEVVAWIEESYRAIAGKKQIQELDRRISAP